MAFRDIKMNKTELLQPRQPVLDKEHSCLLK